MIILRHFPNLHKVPENIGKEALEKRRYKKWSYFKNNIKDVNDWNQPQIENRNNKKFIWRTYLDLSLKHDTKKRKLPFLNVSNNQQVSATALVQQEPYLSSNKALSPVFAYDLGAFSEITESRQRALDSSQKSELNPDSHTRSTENKLKRELKWTPEQMILPQINNP